VSTIGFLKARRLGRQKSIAIEVSIQPWKDADDEDFEALTRRIVENVKKQTATLRGNPRSGNGADCSGKVVRKDGALKHPLFAGINGR
jgi:hypothetical protein